MRPIYINILETFYLDNSYTHIYIYIYIYIFIIENIIIEYIPVVLEMCLYCAIKRQKIHMENNWSKDDNMIS